MAGGRDELVILSSTVSETATFNGNGGQDGLGVENFLNFGEAPEFVGFEFQLI